MHLQVGNIENEYRVFQMDVIAGKHDLETEVKQHTARFKLDYSKARLTVFPNYTLQVRACTAFADAVLVHISCKAMPSVASLYAKAQLNLGQSQCHCAYMCVRS